MSRIIRSYQFFLPTFKVSKVLFCSTHLKCNPRRLQYLELKLFHSFPKAFSAAKNDIMPLNTLEKSIDQLNLDAKYKQKVNLRDINEILSAVEHWGTINYHHSLILLRCCGSLSLDIEPEKRSQLLQKTLSLIENSGIELNISHYNSLLTAYIESEQEFSPKEFLHSVYEKKLVPNKITYQRLLKACCQQGDIAGASEFLEKMKKEELNLNEDIFNSLINGHCQVNDMTSAVAILDLMKNKGIEPSSETFVNLACGYAKVGQIMEIRKILNDCISKDIILLDKDYLQIAYTLATNDQVDHVDEILDKMKKHYGYETYVRHFVLKLLQKNLDSVALKIFETTNSKTNLDDNSKHKKYFIEYVVKCRPVEQIINLCNHLEAKGLVNSPFSIAIRELLLMEETSKAIEMFSVMIKKNLPVRPHYFWPLLIKASKEGNESLLCIVERMKTLKVYPCFQTLSKIIFPNYKIGENWLTDIDKLQNAGIDKIFINRVIFKWLLKEGKLEEAKKFASSSFFSHKAKYYVELIVENLLNNRDAKFFVEMLYIFLHDQESLIDKNDESNFILENEEKEKENTVSKTNQNQELIRSIMIRLSKTCDEQLMLLVLRAMFEKKIKISSEVPSIVKQKFSSAEIKELLSKLSDENLHMDFDDNILNSKKKSQKLRFKENMQEIIWLSNHTAGNNQAKAVENLKDLLSKTSEAFTNVDKKQYKTFMMVLAKTGNYEAVEEVYQKGIECNIIGSRNFYPLVHALIVRDKLEEATDLFCKKALETNCKSSWSEIVTKLIEKQNAEMLQKITDVMTQIDSEAFSIGMLISQFARLGKIKEIQKLLDAKSFMFPRKSLDYVCQWLFKNNSVNGLECLLAATKKVNHINRTNIFNSLLKLYILENNSEKAMALWWHMEEDDVVPSPFFIHEFENFFQKLKKPLPFSLQSTKVKNSRFEGNA